MKTALKSDFPHALRTLRKALGLPQEAFDEISSRTYISALERGIKAPTVGKVEQLAQVMGVHPLTVFALTYASKTPAELDRVLAVVRSEIQAYVFDQPT